MKKEEKRKLFLVWDIVLSLLLAAIGIYLMVQCVSIYRSGAFTPSAVAAAYAPISPAVYIFVALLALRLVCKLWEEPKKEKLSRQISMTYRRSAAKADLSQAQEPEKGQILSLRRSRARNRYISWGLMAAGCIVFLVYALQGSSFDRDATGSMIRAMWWLIPCLVIPFGWGIFAAYQNRRDLEQELELLKKVPKTEPAPLPERKKLLSALRVGILAAAIVLTVIGLNLGGVRDVLTKAINICTECVGLG